MPQENYALIGFDWDRSLEKLKQSSLVVGDLSDEEIERTRSVLHAHIKVKNNLVAFGLSQYGKIQLSHSNNEFLSRAKSNLNKLIICRRWSPIDKPLQEKIPSSKIGTKEQDLRIKRALQDANRISVLRQIEILKETSNLDIIERRSKVLAGLAHKRMAHIPEVLDFYESAFTDDKFKKDNKILRNLITALYLMLGRERYYKPNDYLRKVERIQGKPLEHIIEIMESLTKSNKNDSNVLYEGIYFLRQTDKKESVDTLFKLIEELNNKKYDNMKDNIREALFKEDSELQKNQREYIDDKIDNLLKHKNPRIRKRGKELSARFY